MNRQDENQDAVGTKRFREVTWKRKTTGSGVTVD